MQKDKTTGILLVNLGSPDSFKEQDVKKYLNEFLMDKRVIDIPYLFRKILVEGIILRSRPKKSAALYASIWLPEGSPLVVISKKLQAAVQVKTELPVGLGMRYGSLSIENGIQKLLSEHPNLKELILVPLYPHYAMSSFETVVEKTKEVINNRFPELKLNIMDVFYNNPGYIAALAKSIAPYLKQNFDHILFSYHGIPERHVKKTDPTKNHCLKNIDCCNMACDVHRFCYRHQVFKTTELVCKELGIDSSQFSISFQSRLGADAWLKPYTDYELKRLPKEGKKNILIVCPAFVSDCLETIEEIGKEGRETFMESGGESFSLIPCLNDNPEWVDFLVSNIEKHVDEPEYKPA